MPPAQTFPDALQSHEGTPQYSPQVIKGVTLLQATVRGVLTRKRVAVMLETISRLSGEDWGTIENSLLRMQAWWRMVMAKRERVQRTRSVRGDMAQWQNFQRSLLRSDEKLRESRNGRLQDHGIPPRSAPAQIVPPRPYVIPVQQDNRPQSRNPPPVARPRNVPPPVPDSWPGSEQPLYPASFPAPQQRQHWQGQPIPESPPVRRLLSSPSTSSIDSGPIYTAKRAIPVRATTVAAYPQPSPYSTPVRPKVPRDPPSQRSVFSPFRVINDPTYDRSSDAFPAPPQPMLASPGMSLTGSMVNTPHRSAVPSFRSPTKTPAAASSYLQQLRRVEDSISQVQRASESRAASEEAQRRSESSRRQQHISLQRAMVDVALNEKADRLLLEEDEVTLRNRLVSAARRSLELAKTQELARQERARTERLHQLEEERLRVQAELRRLALKETESEERRHREALEADLLRQARLECGEIASRAAAEGEELSRALELQHAATLRLLLLSQPAVVEERREEEGDETEESVRFEIDSLVASSPTRGKAKLSKEDEHRRRLYKWLQLKLEDTHADEEQERRLLKEEETAARSALEGSRREAMAAASHASVLAELTDEIGQLRTRLRLLEERPAVLMSTVKAEPVVEPETSQSRPGTAHTNTKALPLRKEPFKEPGLPPRPITAGRDPDIQFTAFQRALEAWRPLLEVVGGSDDSAEERNAFIVDVADQIEALTFAGAPPETPRGAARSQALGRWLVAAKKREPSLPAGSLLREYAFRVARAELEKEATASLLAGVSLSVPPSPAVTARPRPFSAVPVPVTLPKPASLAPGAGLVLLGKSAQDIKTTWIPCLCTGFTENVPALTIHPAPKKKRLAAEQTMHFESLASLCVAGAKDYPMLRQVCDIAGINTDPPKAQPASPAESHPVSVLGLLQEASVGGKHPMLSELFGAANHPTTLLRQIVDAERHPLLSGLLWMEQLKPITQVTTPTAREVPVDPNAPQYDVATLTRLHPDSPLPGLNLLSSLQKNQRMPTEPTASLVGLAQHNAAHGLPSLQFLSRLLDGIVPAESRLPTPALALPGLRRLAASAPERPPVLRKLVHMSAQSESPRQAETPKGSTLNALQRTLRLGFESGQCDALSVMAAAVTEKGEPVLQEKPCGSSTALHRLTKLAGSLNTFNGLAPLHAAFEVTDPRTRTPQPVSNQGPRGLRRVVSCAEKDVPFLRQVLRVHPCAEPEDTIPTPRKVVSLQKRNLPVVAEREDPETSEPQTLNKLQQLLGIAQKETCTWAGLAMLANSTADNPTLTPLEFVPVAHPEPELHAASPPPVPEKESRHYPMVIAGLVKLAAQAEQPMAGFALLRETARLDSNPFPHLACLVDSALTPKPQQLGGLEMLNLAASERLPHVRLLESAAPSTSTPALALLRDAPAAPAVRPVLSRLLDLQDEALNGSQGLELLRAALHASPAERANRSREWPAILESQRDRERLQEQAAEYERRRKRQARAAVQVQRVWRGHAARQHVAVLRTVERDRKERQAQRQQAADTRNQEREAARRAQQLQQAEWEAKEEMREHQLRRKTVPVEEPVAANKKRAVPRAIPKKPDKRSQEKVVAAVATAAAPERQPPEKRIVKRKNLPSSETPASKPPADQQIKQDAEKQNSQPHNPSPTKSKPTRRTSPTRQDGLVPVAATEQTDTANKPPPRRVAGRALPSRPAATGGTLGPLRLPNYIKGANGSNTATPASALTLTALAQHDVTLPPRMGWVSPEPSVLHVTAPLPPLSMSAPHVESRLERLRRIIKYDFDDGGSFPKRSVSALDKPVSKHLGRLSPLPPQNSSSVFA